MRPQQTLDYRRAVTKLTTWLASSAHPPTVEAVTKRVASDYRMATFVRPGVNPKTANKDTSAVDDQYVCGQGDDGAKAACVSAVTLPSG